MRTEQLLLMLLPYLGSSKLALAGSAEWPRMPPGDSAGQFSWALCLSRHCKRSMAWRAAKELALQQLDAQRNNSRSSWASLSRWVLRPRQLPASGLKRTLPLSSVETRAVVNDHLGFAKVGEGQQGHPGRCPLQDQGGLPCLLPEHLAYSSL